MLDARFELESLVGSGGTADVHGARELVSGSRVALKLLRPSTSERPDRFRREGAVLARLSHRTSSGTSRTGRAGTPIGWRWSGWRARRDRPSGRVTGHRRPERPGSQADAR